MKNGKIFIKNFLKNLSLVCFSLVIIFVFGEILTRLLWRAEIISLDSIGPVNRSYIEELNDPDLLYVLKPNIDVTVREGFRVKTNDDGFREDKNYALVKDKDTYRIFVLGDSVSFGLGVNADETFPKILEKKLNQNSESLGYKKFEVINASVPAYHLLFYRNIYYRKVRKYHPDFLIIGYCFNDAQDTYYAYKYATGKSSGSAIRIPPFLKRLLRRSVFYVSVAHEVNKFRAVIRNRIELAGMKLPREDEKVPKIIPKKEETSGRRLEKDCSVNFFIIRNGLSGEGWGYIKNEEIKRYKDIAKNDNIGMLFVMFPTFVQLDDDYPCVQEEAGFKNLIESSGFHCLNLFSYYKGMNERDISIEAIHPNAKGHRIAADAIYAYMAENILRK